MSATATLAVHAGGIRVTRAELKDIHPTHAATRTFKPIHHADLMDSVERALRNYGIHHTREEYAVSRNGSMMFGVMDLEFGSVPGCTAALGIRTANDRSMAVQMTVGMRVFICDNMAFSSDGIALRRKHTSGFQLKEEMVRAVDVFAGRYLTMEQQVGSAQNRQLTDDDAKVLIFESFRQELLPQRFLTTVAKHYFEPAHEEFRPRTAWSLHNAYTETFKLMPPVPAHAACRRVSRLLGLTSTTAGQVIDAADAAVLE